MPRVQDLFKRPDGGKLLDVKLLMTIDHLPSEPVQKETTPGTHVTVYPVIMNHQGESYEWDLNEAQMKRIFVKSDKAGNVTWSARTGDSVNVWYASPKKVGGNPYYLAEPCNDSVTTQQEVSAVFSESDDGELTPKLPTAPKKATFAKTYRTAPAGAVGGDTKWDGTPRQGNFRAGYAGILQSILCNPNVNPLDDEQREKAHIITAQEVVRVRYESKALEASTQD